MQTGTDDGASPAGAVVEPTGQEISYRVFTTAHDRVVNAATLAGRDELEQLRRSWTPSSAPRARRWRGWRKNSSAC